jgi:hypothetical protein
VNVTVVVKVTATSVTNSHSDHERDKACGSKNPQAFPGLCGLLFRKAGDI